MMTTFTENPQTYIGTHRYTAAPVFERCRCSRDCIALIGTDQNPRPVWSEYRPLHAVAAKR